MLFQNFVLKTIKKKKKKMNDLDKKWIKTFLGKKEIPPRCLNDYIFHKDKENQGVSTTSNYV